MASSTSSQETQTFRPIALETRTLMYRYQRTKHQMDRNAFRIGVLKFGIVYQGMQKRHLLLVVFNLDISCNEFAI